MRASRLAATTIFWWVFLAETGREPDHTVGHNIPAVGEETRFALLAILLISIDKTLLSNRFPADSGIAQRLEPKLEFPEGTRARCFAREVAHGLSGVLSPQVPVARHNLRFLVLGVTKWSGYSRLG